MPMSDSEIRQSKFDWFHLKNEIEDGVRYGSPSNTRMVLRNHPEHLPGLFFATYEWKELSVPLGGKT